MSVKKEGGAKVVRAIRSDHWEVAGLKSYKPLTIQKAKVDQGQSRGKGDSILLQFGHEEVAVDPVVKPHDVDEPAHPRGLGRHVGDLHSVQIAETLVVPGSDPERQRAIIVSKP